MSNFHPLEVEDRGSETQLQVSINLILCNLSHKKNQYIVCAMLALLNKLLFNSHFLLDA